MSDLSRLQRMLEELQTYRAELEQQNAELVVAQVALENSRAEFARLFDFSPVGIALLDARNQVERANPVVSRLFGRPRHALVGRTLLQFLTPDCHREVISHLLAARFASVARSTRVGVQPADAEGPPRTCRLVSQRMGEGGEQVVIALVDITESEALARKLEAREARYRALFASSRDGLIAYNPDEGTVVDANPAAAQLLGEPGGLEGLGLDGLLGEAAAAVDGAVLRALAGGTGAADEVPVQRPNQPLRWMEVLVSAVPTEASSRVLISLRDVTARHQQAVANAALEARLAQMDRLEAVGKLAGGLAHDMNNLLTVIVGLASALRDGGGVDDAARVDLDDLLLAAGQAREITDDLLAFARRGKGHREPMDTRSICDAVLALATRRASQAPQPALVVEPGPAWWVAADRGALVRAVFNLVLNAMAASKPEGRVRLRSERLPWREVQPPEPVEPEPTWAVVIEVIDEGHGMPKAVMERALDPYFTTRRQGEGTGLGLPMVFGTARSHGGWLTLESEVGRGTRARLVLPAIPAPARVTSGAARPVERFEGRCLLADDDRAVRAVTERLLHRLGFTVVAVEGGAEAVAAFKADPGVDLVVLDVRMPDVDGVTAARRIRGQRGDVPVLFCSAWPEVASGEDIDTLPGAAFLAKPFQPAELAQAVGRLLTTR